MDIKKFLNHADSIEGKNKEENTQDKQKLDEAASVNISMTGDGAGDVAQLMGLLKNAGLDNAGPAGADGQDLDTTPCGMDKSMAGRGPGPGPAAGPGPTADLYGDEGDEKPEDLPMKMDAESEEDDDEIEEWDNDPDETYQDDDYMTHDLAGGINKQKKMYKSAERGDNAMSAESIKERLERALEEKKKSGKSDQLKGKDKFKAKKTKGPETKHPAQGKLVGEDEGKAEDPNPGTENLKKGEKVNITGGDHKGKSGTVKKADVRGKNSLVTVDGNDEYINTKHIKPAGKNESKDTVSESREVDDIVKLALHETGPKPKSQQSSDTSDIAKLAGL